MALVYDVNCVSWWIMHYLLKSYLIICQYVNICCKACYCWVLLILLIYSFYYYTGMACCIQYCYCIGWFVINYLFIYKYGIGNTPIWCKLRLFLLSIVNCVYVLLFIIILVWLAVFGTLESNLHNLSATFVKFDTSKNILSTLLFVVFSISCLHSY